MTRDLTDHPLMARTELRSVRAWSEFLALWSSTNDVLLLESLLHHGYSPNIRLDGYSEADRLAFYLRIADGWNAEQELFCLPGESGSGYRGVLDEIGRSPFYRQELAYKSFKVLGMEVFAKVGTEPAHLAHQKVLRDPKSLGALLRFFRYDPQSEHIPNLVEHRSACRHLREARNYALLLAEWGFGLSAKVQVGANSRTLETLVAESRPRFIEILFALGEIERVQKPSEYPLDDACWARLMELALLPIYGDEPSTHYTLRQPNSIAEAIALGSKAAQAYEIRRIREEQKKRRDEIQRLRDTRRIAEAQLEELGA